MINPTGANQLAKKIAEKSLQEGAQAPQAAKPDDAARMQEAMQPRADPNAGQHQPATVDRVAGVGGVDADAQVGKPRSAGDAILNGMDKLRGEFHELADPSRVMQRPGQPHPGGRTAAAGSRD